MFSRGAMRPSRSIAVARSRSQSTSTEKYKEWHEQRRGELGELCHAECEPGIPKMFRGWRRLRYFKKKNSGEDDAECRADVGRHIMALREHRRVERKEECRQERPQFSHQSPREEINEE